ncbi:MAG: PorV/PorQ family protein [Candidatus Margulisbacteria bacterium]|nr:PorV/PorQ family protein [Candidatus Margulisiibacteriota bacterium]MBU1021456.1 PorV/PorQ family protein [Candidatus Margulisiibacteriota bacterium]MBU1728377.1 PorV/PorQ family protein [Candidatus Margulisiibacteriota bacterium]MBU1955880.1 PorV/PorQ family protein [Candidatus Margulisiibacteriota bacterium]
MINKKLVSKVILTLIVLVAMAGSAVADSAIADPLSIAVGARPLGMGKAYVGIAEDAETLFINPAGLGTIKSAKLTSMYTSLMGDVNYMMVGGIYPLEDGAVGLGLATAGVADIPLYDNTGASLGSGTWSESVFLASYGTDMSKFGGNEDIKIGASLKYYSSGGTGTSTVAAGAGSGFDIDLGVLYQAKPWLTVGAALQNVFPGGAVARKTGQSDLIESVYKVGAKVNVMGNASESLNPSDNKLILSADLDLNGQSGLGTGTHIGAEFWPVDALALRCGMDSDPSAAGVNSNITAGLGVRYGGMEFNYAYHPYSSIAEDTTHFFSIGYVGEEIAVVAPPNVTILSPDDKTITNSETIKVVGIVENVSPSDLKFVSVTVNGVNAPMDETGKFELSYQLEKLGKKLLVIEATGASGPLASSDRRILRLASFVDVGRGYWAKNPIEESSTVGLVQGYPDGTFRPDKALTRAELATLLVRAMEVDMHAGYGKPFKDVKEDHWAVEYISAAKRAGYMAGYPDGSFKPNKKITKVEGVTVMARLDRLPLQAYSAAPYSDIGSKHWAARYVQAAKDAGILDYVKGYELKAKDDLTRAETIEMMAKTKFAGAQIQELLSWFVGFKKEAIPERKETTSQKYKILTSGVTLN